MSEPVKKTNILIVDSVSQNYPCFKAILDKLDQNLIFANSAEEALRQILQYDFSVILLDLDLPDMKGFETAQLLRAGENASYAPIIFLRVNNQSELEVNQENTTAAVNYILKPINPLILYSKVKAFVDLFITSTLGMNLQNVHFGQC